MSVSDRIYPDDVVSIVGMGRFELRDEPYPCAPCWYEEVLITLRDGRSSTHWAPADERGIAQARAMLNVILSG